MFLCNGSRLARCGFSTARTSAHTRNPQVRNDFAFGSDDFVIILDLPDNIDMAATAIVAQASGMVKSRVTVLMAPEDVDQAVQRKVDFRPPS